MSGRKSNIKQFLVILPYILVVVLAAIMVVPVLWIFSTAIKPMNEILSFPPRWIAKEPSLEFFGVFLKGRAFFSYIRNSFFVASITTAICVLLGLLSGYSISRMKFKGKNLIAVGILATRLFPPIALVTPWYMIGHKMHILDSWIILIAAYTYMNLPFVIWIMMGFFDQLPVEIDEAARVDGCTKVQALLNVIFPIAQPGIVTAGIFVFLLSWNEYLLAATLTMSPNAKTLPLTVMEFIADEYIIWNELSAAAIIASIPAFIFMIFSQKYIVSGLSAGAVKG